MIRVEHLSRSYGATLAVDDVSFEVGEGEIVGLLGHNGAGKTTIMKMLTGTVEPSAGRAAVAGLDVQTEPRAVRERIGYLPENCPIYPDMTVVDFLYYAASLKGFEEAQAADAVRVAVEATDLAEKITAPIATLSRGFRQRVGVAQAILGTPPLIILDEPTNGLDPSQIKQMRALITRLAETATIILSTHILQEVQAVCSRVLVLHRSRLALDAPLAQLQGAPQLRLTTRAEPTAVEGVLADIPRVHVRDHTPAGDAHTYILTVEDALDAAAPAIARAVCSAGLDLLALHPQSQDLESVFAAISEGRSPELAASGVAETSHDEREAAHV